jgi:hypothetical protein
MMHAKHDVQIFRLTAQEAVRHNIYRVFSASSLLLDMEFIEKKKTILGSSHGEIPQNVLLDV